MSLDSPPSRYRRRHRWPMLVALVILLAGAVVVWAQILKPAPPLATGCNAPLPPPTTSSAASTTSAADGSGATSGSSTSTSGTASSDATSTSTTSSTTRVTTSLGTFIDPNRLAAIRPADPSGIPIRVLNASGVVGQAKTVTDELRDAGFTSIEEAANDPLYPQWKLHCYGEIRYGHAGLAEARTVLRVAPCAQLVLDDRIDNSVDLSLGELYEVEPISKAVRKRLQEIKDAAAPPPVIEGQTISVRPVRPVPPLPSRSGCPDQRS